MDNHLEREQAKDFSTLFQQMKTDVASYVNHRLAHYRLDILEKTSQYSSLIALVLIVAFIGFTAFTFALVGLAFYVGELLESTAAGFGIVALFWFILLLLVLLLRNPIKSFFLNKAAKILYKIEKEEDDKNE